MNELQEEAVPEPSQLDRIEAKLDMVLAFEARIAKLIEPYEPLLQGRSSRAAIAVLKARGQL